MIKLNFNVNNTELKRIDTFPVISKSKRMHQAVFDFDGEIWRGVEKIAIFTDSWGKSRRMYLGKYKKCKCIIPDKALTGTYFSIVVYGGDLITTNEISVPLVYSSYKKF